MVDHPQHLWEGFSPQSKWILYLKEQGLALGNTRRTCADRGRAHPGVAAMATRTEEDLEKDIYIIEGGYIQARRVKCRSPRCCPEAKGIGH